MVMVLGGLGSFVLSLIIHDYLAHEIGWSLFNRVTAIPQETILTGIWGLGSIFTVIFGALLRLLVD
jgi:hypothetical protein